MSRTTTLAWMMLVPLLWMADGEMAGAARRGKIPVLLQITFNTMGDVQGPKVAPQRGDFVTFVSDGDVLGPGTAPGHREVYLFNVVSPSITRITYSGSGESFEATRVADAGKPGRYMAFVSTADLDPLGDNSDGNAEVFAWHLLSGEVIQVTRTGLGAENRRPWVSDSAKCIAFDSNGDLNDNDGTKRPSSPGTGNANPDGSREAFLFEVIDGDLRGGMTTQLSDGPAGTTSSNVVSGGWIFSHQCRSTGFQSDHDQLALGTSGIQVYVYTRTSGRLSLISTPGTEGNSINPYITGASRFARGPFIVFQSDGDLVGNRSSNFEVFRARVFHRRLRQRSYLDSGNAERPVISDGGGYVVFESDTRSIFTKNGVPLNPDGNHEIFRLKGSRKVVQISNSENCVNDQVSTGDDARTLAFRSTCDLVPGNNANGLPQLFLYREVRADNPILGGCQVSAGCCSEANGCFTRIQGKMPKVPRR